MSLIEIEGLEKHFKVLNRREGLLGSMKDLFSGDYRMVKAVDGISLSIEEGELVGFLGPNGAGKSTTIKMMVGALMPSSGKICINGFVPFKDRRKYVKQIGVVLGQRSQLWWDIPVIESFKVLKEIYEVSDRDYAENMELFHSLLDIKNILRTPVRNLSLGQRTLSDILAAFLHKPKVIFLDEPTIGLDVSIKSKIRKLIKQLNEIRNTTVILTSHDVGDVEALCNRIIMIDKGRILYDGETRAFHRLFSAYRTLKVRLDGSGLSENQLMAAVNNKLMPATPISIQEMGDAWASISFNEEEINLLDVLKCVMDLARTLDIKVEEVRLEDLIRKSYEGAMS
jgi:ABC-2 type transport system ATP-binding protein